MIKNRFIAASVIFTMASFVNAYASPTGSASKLPYVIISTNQRSCYDNFNEIYPPSKGKPFYGQDAQFQQNKPSYSDNHNGTITDINTGLTWVKARGEKVSWQDAYDGAKNCNIGGFHDWRMPSIKELYSLMDFNGYINPRSNIYVPFINTHFFDFVYGNVNNGERIIDCQDWSSTKYTGTTMINNKTAFGVNFADGRIKGYPILDPRTQTSHKLYVRYVRGNTDYGKNNFVDNGNGTITDKATGLMWQKYDSGKCMNWQDALSFAGNLKLGGYGDWRLPNAKELQSIVDYTRSPQATNSAAINSIFSVTEVESYFWTSTTHHDGPLNLSNNRAVYIAFGQAFGYMRIPPTSSTLTKVDVHGAGAQRSDPKSGNPADFPYGNGPQGDDIRIYNYVRCVRNANP